VNAVVAQRQQPDALVRHSRRAALAQRQLALAGLALLAGILALGLSSRQSSGPKPPESIPAPGGGWYQAAATAGGPTFRRVHRDEACGRIVKPTDLGVANPVLPCDTKIAIQFGNVEAFTQVIAREPATAEADFELTPALAQRLGLHGNQLIGWRYAR
jgi:hypothetical protein